MVLVCVGKAKLVCDLYTLKKYLAILVVGEFRGPENEPLFLPDLLCVIRRKPYVSL